MWGSHIFWRGAFVRVTTLDWDVKSEKGVYQYGRIRQS